MPDVANRRRVDREAVEWISAHFRTPSARRKRRALKAEINVVPYIDVMLVLLVIFMVTAPLINTSMVDLPSVSRSNQPPANPLEVMIRQDGTILLRDRE
ncbi:MAG: hypothetical protein HC807_05275, partial [Gammaproteobacteria bacterium]|nr:hypothetical protein [Gammaproteobacteria bacterium]